MLILYFLGFFDKAEGSLSRGGEVLFWTGVLFPQSFIARPTSCFKVERHDAGDFSPTTVSSSMSPLKEDNAKIDIRH